MENYELDFVSLLACTLSVILELKTSLSNIQICRKKFTWKKIPWRNFALKISTDLACKSEISHSFGELKASAPYVSLVELAFS